MTDYERTTVRQTVDETADPLGRIAATGHDAPRSPGRRRLEPEPPSSASGRPPAEHDDRRPAPRVLLFGIPRRSRSSGSCSCCRGQPRQRDRRRDLTTPSRSSSRSRHVQLRRVTSTSTGSVFDMAPSWPSSAGRSSRRSSSLRLAIATARPSPERRPERPRSGPARRFATGRRRAVGPSFAGGTTSRPDTPARRAPTARPDPAGHEAEIVRATDLGGSRSSSTVTCTSDRRLR